jgi:hypothetical protein
VWGLGFELREGVEEWWGEGGGFGVLLGDDDDDDDDEGGKGCLGGGWRGWGERIGSVTVEVGGGCCCCCCVWAGVVGAVVCSGLLFGFEDEDACCCGSGSGCEIVVALLLGSDALPSTCPLSPFSGVDRRPFEVCSRRSVKRDIEDFSSEISTLRLVFNEPSSSRATTWLAPSEHEHHDTASGAKGS